jgi:hypothetical protein
MASINYYINQSVLGGTSAPRYSDPLVTGAPNQDGLYPWSSYRARLGNTSATPGKFTPTVGTTLDAGDTINLLLFTSDVPAGGSLVETLAPGAVVTQGLLAPTTAVGGALALAFFKTTSTGGTNVTVSAGQVGVGYVITGAAAPNAAISTTGFPASVGVGVNGTAANTFDLLVTANGATIASPVSTLNFGALTADAATCGFLPIILLYSDYTQAIRDAGNVFVATEATTKDVKYQVVGLYSRTPAPTPP